MQKDYVKNKSGVDKTFNIVFDIEYLHPDFIAPSQKDNFIEETGLMKVFELSSKKTEHPNFIGRWDEKKDTLDVDICNVDNIERLKFLTEEEGYIGHHTQSSKSGPRTLEIHIEILGTVFFVGKISLGLGRTLRLEPLIFKLN